MDADPIFEPLPKGYAPTVHAAGPWDPAYLHGGAVSALVAREVERVMAEAEGEGTVVRLSVDLVRPVPRTPLVVHSQVTGASRNVRRCTVAVDAGDVTVATGSAAVVRRAALGHETVDGDERLEPGPGEGVGTVFPHEGAEPPGAFHRTGMEVRFVSGGFDRPGPARAWFRFRRPLVGDEVSTPLQTAAAASDFGNGISWTLPSDRWVFINPDLTVHFARPPAGDWIGMASRTIAWPVGAGMAESALFDETGRVGRAVQSLFVDARR